MLRSKDCRLPTNSNSTGSLEINDSNVNQTFLGKLNDRMRRISQLVSAGSFTSDNSDTSATELILSVPGTLSVESNAAPAVTLGTPTSFTTAVVLVKTAPQGNPLALQLYVNGSGWGQALSLPANSTSLKVGLSGVSAIAADQLIRLDITGVGLTFPGSDLTVILR